MEAPPPPVNPNQGSAESEVSSEKVVPQSPGSSMGEKTEFRGKTDNLIEKKSWANVAKGAYKQHDYVVSEVDGDQRVIVPKEILQNAKPLWEDFLIGKFLSDAPHVGKIHVVVNKIWRLGDKSSMIDVYPVNHNTVKFRVRNGSMKQRILNRGMWNILNIPMIISKWSPFAEEAQPALKSIPLWVTLKKVLPSLFTDKGFEFLASAVGKLIKLHPKTEACHSFDEAQLFIEANLTKELPRTYHFLGEEEGELDANVEYSYPWLPPKCVNCRKWGHYEDDCFSDKKQSEKESEKEEKIDEQDEIVRIAQEEGGLLNVNQTNSELTQKELEEGEWVTPLKGGRSQEKNISILQRGTDSLLKNSYAVLSEDIEKEENAEEVEDVGEVLIDHTIDDTANMVEEKEQESEIKNHSASTERSEATTGTERKTKATMKPDLQIRRTRPRSTKKGRFGAGSSTNSQLAKPTITVSKKNYTKSQ